MHTNTGGRIPATIFPGRGFVGAGVARFCPRPARYELVIYAAPRKDEGLNLSALRFEVVYHVVSYLAAACRPIAAAFGGCGRGF